MFGKLKHSVISHPACDAAMPFRLIIKRSWKYACLLIVSLCAMFILAITSTFPAWIWMRMSRMRSHTYGCTASITNFIKFIYHIRYVCAYLFSITFVSGIYESCLFDPFHRRLLARVDARPESLRVRTSVRRRSTTTETIPAETHACNACNGDTMTVILSAYGVADMAFLGGGDGAQSVIETEIPKMTQHKFVCLCALCVRTRLSCIELSKLNQHSFGAQMSASAVSYRIRKLWLYNNNNA